MNLNISDTFNKELPADLNITNSRRQVIGACFSNVRPRIPSKPLLVHASDEMLEAIGAECEDKDSKEFLHIFSGVKVLENTAPYAMCYGGHQFGHWAGQLGDGRAINLAEVVHNDKRWALQLKGAGETPYSRSADGLAVLRSSIREHLCSEAMYHLGVPTTRSLSIMKTGDEVLRDVLYNGNADYEKGAVVCRAAPSFIRFGNFQILAARQDIKNLEELTNYTIRHFFPHITAGTKDGYIQFFQEICDLTLDMIIHWQRVGFVHGVMNTDNMSILGLTIDYGPYGWLEGYDSNWTPNTTDSPGLRYRFGNQAGVSLWNLAQLGNSLNLLINEAKPLEDILDKYRERYSEKYMSMMRSKLGFQLEKDEDEEIISTLEKMLQVSETDMTIFFRNLSRLDRNSKTDDNGDFLQAVREAFYKPQEIKDEILELWGDWFDKYLIRLQEEEISTEMRRTLMNRVNPKYVLRNYMAQMAIDEANKDDYSLIDELYIMLKKPYEEQGEYQKWFAKRPEWARNKVGCSMLSCSS